MFLLPLGIEAKAKTTPWATFAVVLVISFFSILHRDLSDRLDKVYLYSPERLAYQRELKAFLVARCPSELGSPACERLNQVLPEQLITGDLLEIFLPYDGEPETRRLHEWLHPWLDEERVAGLEPQDPRVRALTVKLHALRAKLREFSETHQVLSSENVGLPALIKSQFLHAGLSHLLGNLIFLLFLAFPVEQRLGFFRFLLVYFLGGTAGMGLQALGGGPSIMIVGASANVFAVSGAFLSLFWRHRMRVLVSFFFLHQHVVLIPVLAYFGFWVAGEEILGVVSRQPDGIAHWAHVGGFLAGACLGKILDFYPALPSGMVYPFEKKYCDQYNTVTTDIERLGILNHWLDANPMSSMAARSAFLVAENLILAGQIRRSVLRRLRDHIFSSILERHFADPEMLSLMPLEWLGGRDTHVDPRKIQRALSEFFKKKEIWAEWILLSHVLRVRAYRVPPSWERRFRALGKEVLEVPEYYRRLREVAARDNLFRRFLEDTGLVVESGIPQVALKALDLVAAGNPYEESEPLTMHLLSFPPAGFDQRLMAATVDLLVLVLWTRILMVIGMTPWGWEAEIFLLNFALYFTLAHWWTGATIGKYLVGLRLEGRETRGFLSLLRIFYRETLGRFLAFLPGGAGYLAVLFRHDRKAWHDNMARTRVISLKEIQGSFHTQLLRGALGLMIAGFLIVGFTAVSFLATTAPLENLRRRVAWLGIHIDGGKGSLVEGYQVDRLYWERDGNKVDLRDVRVRIDPWILISSSGLRIRSIHISQGEIRIDQETLRDLRGMFLSPSRPLAPGLFLEGLDLSRISVKVGDENYLIRRLFVADFKVGRGGWSLGRLYLDSSALLLNAARMNLKKGYLRMDSPLRGTLRKELFPNVLRRDLSFQFVLEGPSDRPRFRADLFNSQLHVERSDQELKVELRDYSPVHYFQGDWPLHRISLRANGPLLRLEDLEAVPVNGHFQFHQERMTLLPGQTVGTLIQEGFRSRPAGRRPASVDYQLVLYPHLFDGRSPWASILHGEQKLDLRDGLRKLFPGGSGKEASVEGDLRFLEKSLFGLESLFIRKPEEPL